jgi:hypothetical protein
VQAPLPESMEHFFAEIQNFLKTNAQGDVRCVIISETSTGQFWVNGMGLSTTWMMGMLKRANASVDVAFSISLMEKHEENKEALEQQQLKAMETPEGKPQ